MSNAISNSFRRDLGLSETPPADTILVHFFKPSGKWYTSADIDYVSRDSIDQTFDASLRKYSHHHGMLAVCLEFPQHPFDHPIMLKVPK